MDTLQRPLGHRDGPAGDHIRRAHRGRHVSVALPGSEDIRLWRV